MKKGKEAREETEGKAGREGKLKGFEACLLLLIYRRKGKLKVYKAWESKIRKGLETSCIKTRGTVANPETIFPKMRTSHSRKKM